MPEPSKMPTLPRHADEVTPAWLTAVLHANGIDADVATIERSRVGEGVGMMSGLSKLELTYARGTGPAAIVYKHPADHDGNRAVADAFHLYEREVLFYRDVAHRSRAYTPHVYYAAIDGPDFALLMEDLSDYELGDQVKGCSLEQARAGMAWMAQHHAASWGRVDDPVFDFLPYVSPSYSSEALQQGAAYGWDPMVEAFGHVLPEHVRALKDRYLAVAQKLFDWMATPPLTVVHGDFRMDNLFFAGRPGQHGLIALDWQGALRGRATQDIAYFLSGSIPTDMRRAHERELIALWHEKLVAEGVTGYSLDDAWDDYRRATLYVWIIAVVIAGTLDSSNERGKAWMSAMLARSVAAIDDLGLLDLLAEYEAK